MFVDVGGKFARHFAVFLFHFSIGMANLLKEIPSSKGSASGVDGTRVPGLFVVIIIGFANPAANW